jgi:hypothetical protein
MLSGSFLTHMAHGNINKLRLLSEIPCLLISLFIILLAYEIGKDFEILNKDNIIIGNDINVLNYPIDDIKNGLIPGNEYPGDEYPGDKYPGDNYPGDKFPGDKYPGDEYTDISHPGDTYGVSTDRTPYVSQPGDIEYPVLQTRNGLNPGDIGYDGYNLKLFEGVFDNNEVINNEKLLSKPIQEFYDR